MLTILAAILLSSSKSEVPPDRWSCQNEIEVWCAVDGCAAKSQDETTPMSISAGRDGAFSVCAYTGCWEGQANVHDLNGRLLWAADGAEFSTNPGGFNADVSLLIIEKDGVGFVRVGGIASPLLCTRRSPGQ
ncbi:hypothetical protein [Hyphococcus sp. DH-69]|uniref:hypothetical protein n=1 Tax=Hyphococcus formosus TaxID=3143534 RepID=UPI00398B55CD